MKKIVLTTIMIFAVVFAASAQPGFDTDVPDTAPISGLVYLGMAIAAGLGINKSLKK